MSVLRLSFACISLLFFVSPAVAIQTFEFSGSIRQVNQSLSGETVPIVAGEPFTGTLIYTPETAIVRGDWMLEAFRFEFDIGEVVIKSSWPEGTVGGGIWDLPFTNVTSPDWFAGPEFNWGVDIDSLLPESIPASSLIASWSIFWNVNSDFDEILVLGDVTSAREVPSKVPEPGTLWLLSLSLMLVMMSSRRTRHHR